MKHIKLFESKKDYFKISYTDFNDELRTIMENHIKLHNQEVKILSDFLFQYKRKITIHKDTYSTDFNQTHHYFTHLSISGLDHPLSVYKGFDDYFIVEVKYHLSRAHYKCDQIHGVIEFLTDEFLRGLSKKENEPLKMTVRKMITKLDDDKVLKVKEFIETLK